MKSSIVKHSVSIGRNKTSVTLEDVFWNLLKEIANERHETVSNLVAKIDADRHYGNLSSAIRLFVLDRTRNQALAQVSKQNTQLAVA
jgi:predicted DNA-binding ribbon-helix-helix protein